MANHSVDHLLDLINRQISEREDLGECLYKAEAMFAVALVGDGDFLDRPQKTLHDYFWALGDLVEKARELNERGLDELVKNLPANAHTVLGS